MGYKYTYSVANDTVNGTVDVAALQKQIRDSEVTVAVDYINSGGDDIDIWMKAELESADENNLTGIVAGHNGIPLPEDLTPKMADGRPIVRSDSRPLGTNTYFTCMGDETGIGDGKEMYWDFSNNDDEVIPVEHGSGWRSKELPVRFNDPVFIKEGTIYFFGAQKRSHIHFDVVCPAGQFYLDRQGNPQYASEDVVILKYVVSHFFAGDCPMGDELNTEGCQESALPPNYIIKMRVEVPSTDNSSYGWGSMELYRARTCLLPGESI